MNNIIVNPNINSSIKNVNHLYPIDVSLSWKLADVNYGEGIKNYKDGIVHDLRELFFTGADARLDSDNTKDSPYNYINYAPTNIDKIPTTTSYGEFRKIVDQIIFSKERERKTNLVNYFDNIVFGDFVLNYYSGVISKITTEITEINNKDNQIVKSYIPGYYKFLHVKKAPKDLCAYINIRGILFKMNKISDTSESTEFEFQYPAFLLEQYNDLANSVLNISFNMAKTDLIKLGIEIYGATESGAGNIKITPTPFRGLNYFKKF